MNRSMQFTLAILFLGCSCLFGCTSQQWQTWKSDELGVQIDFPAKPKAQTFVEKPTPRTKLETLVVQAKPYWGLLGTTYTLSIADLSTFGINQFTWDDKAAFEGAKRNALLRTKGTLDDEQDIKVFGFPGKLLIISSSLGKMYLKLFRQHNRLYQLSVVFPTDKDPYENRERFEQSLKILTPGR